MPDTPTLAEMTPRAQSIALAYYERGAIDGWRLGYAAAEAEYAELHRRAHAVVQHTARTPAYAELCERRGEHHRAEANRRTLVERGIGA